MFWLPKISTSLQAALTKLRDKLSARFSSPANFSRYKSLHQDPESSTHCTKNDYYFPFCLSPCFRFHDKFLKPFLCRQMACLFASFAVFRCSDWPVSSLNPSWKELGLSSFASNAAPFRTADVCCLPSERFYIFLDFCLWWRLLIDYIQKPVTSS